MVSSGLPVLAARISFRRCLIFSMRSTWICISVACPCVPPEGWWIMISALGSARRLPFVPDESRNAPIDAAMPTQMVDTSHLMNCMVS